MENFTDSSLEIHVTVMKSHTWREQTRDTMGRKRQNSTESTQDIPVMKNNNGRETAIN